MLNNSLGNYIYQGGYVSGGVYLSVCKIGKKRKMSLIILILLKTEESYVCT